MSNTAKAITDFQAYLSEIDGDCSKERLAVIRREAVTCQDLINYSPESCWELDEFKWLDAVVALVLTKTAKV